MTARPQCRAVARPSVSWCSAGAMDAMIEPNNPILSKMLDRLFAAMLNGPSMNCRPHASRQRLDLVQLAKLRDIPPGDVLLAMMGKEGSIKLAARVPVVARKNVNEDQETP